MFDFPSDKDDPRERPSSPDPHHEITRRLKAFYTAVESEPVPDRFMDLLDKLDEAEKAHAAKGSVNDN